MTIKMRKKVAVMFTYYCRGVAVGWTAGWMPLRTCDAPSLPPSAMSSLTTANLGSLSRSFSVSRLVSHLYRCPLKKLASFASNVATVRASSAANRLSASFLVCSSCGGPSHQLTSEHLPQSY